jgi:hypothetical protein
VRFLFIFCLTLSCAHDRIKVQNWELIYSQELNAALLNDDYEAFAFFWPLYLQERYKNKLKHNNDSTN